MARDQFLESCIRELYVHLKPKTFQHLDEMAKEADLFLLVAVEVFPIDAVREIIGGMPTGKN